MFFSKQRKSVCEECVCHVSVSVMQRVSFEGCTLFSLCRAGRFFKKKCSHIETQANGPFCCVRCSDDGVRKTAAQPLTWGARDRGDLAPVLRLGRPEDSAADHWCVDAHQFPVQATGGKHTIWAINKIKPKAFLAARPQFQYQKIQENYKPCPVWFMIELNWFGFFWPPKSDVISFFFPLLSQHCALKTASRKLFMRRSLTSSSVWQLSPLIAFHILWMWKFWLLVFLVYPNNERHSRQREAFANLLYPSEALIKRFSGAPERLSLPR